MKKRNKNKEAKPPILERRIMIHADNTAIPVVIRVGQRVTFHTNGLGDVGDATIDNVEGRTVTVRANLLRGRFRARLDERRIVILREIRNSPDHFTVDGTVRQLNLNP